MFEKEEESRYEFRVAAQPGASMLTRAVRPPGEYRQVVKRISRMSVVFALGLLAAASARATLVIDAFGDNSLSVSANGPNGTASDFIGCTACVGGERDFEIAVSAGDSVRQV